MGVDVEKLIEESRMEVLNYLKKLNNERIENFQLDNPGLFTILARKLNQIFHRFGYHITSWKKFSNFIKNFTFDPFSKLMAFSTLQQISDNPEDWNSLFDKLFDDYSKDVLRWFIKARVAYSMVGKLAFQIFPFKNNNLSKFERFEEKCFRRRKIMIDGFQLNLLSFQCAIFAHLLIMKQYSYKDIVYVSENDMVFDVGALSGDTSIFFAVKARKGKVYAFEPSPKDYEKLLKTLKMNPKISNVIPQKVALGDRSGKVQIIGSGGRAYVGEGNGVDVDMLTLDEFVEMNNIERVDFIKMDVEGFEMNILRGSENTIKRFKPKLAISIYHPENNPVEIVNFLKNLNPGYKFFLDHHGIFSLSETILYSIDI